jgi:hypothetical protein
LAPLAVIDSANSAGPLNGLVRPAVNRCGGDRAGRRTAQLLGIDHDGDQCADSDPPLEQFFKFLTMMLSSAGAGLGDRAVRDDQAERLPSDCSRFGLGVGSRPLELRRRPMQPKADQVSFRDMERRAILMSSFRGRLQLADAERAQAEQAAQDPLQRDPFFLPLSRLRGKPDYDGFEYLTSQQLCDALEIPMASRRAGLWRRITKLMVAQNWEPIRIKKNGVDGGGVTERVRGYRRKTNSVPYPHISKEFPGKVNTSTPYIIGKVVSRLEMDSRWALARSIRALVAERDTLKEKLDGNFNTATGSGPA